MQLGFCGGPGCRSHTRVLVLSEYIFCMSFLRQCRLCVGLQLGERLHDVRHLRCRHRLILCQNTTVKPESAQAKQGHRACLPRRFGALGCWLLASPSPRRRTAPALGSSASARPVPAPPPPAPTAPTRLPAVALLPPLAPPALRSPAAAVAGGSLLPRQCWRSLARALAPAAPAHAWYV